MRDGRGAKRFLDRYFWVVVTAIVAAAASIEVTSALGETQTWDEGIHISAGYAYWTRADFRWNPEHPPLAKLVSSLPLLALPVRLPVESEGWRNEDEIQLGIDFLYHNRTGADEILLAARSMNMLLSCLFLFAMAWLARRRFGDLAALLAVTLCAFDPNLIAHSRYVTTDYPVTVFLFLTALLWMEYLLSGRLRDLMLASAAFALALTTKFSAFLLLPGMAILYAIRWRQAPAEFSLGRAAKTGVFLAGTSLAAVGLVYGQETWDSFSAETPTLADAVERGNFTGEVLYKAGRWFHLPAHPFLTGLAEVAAHNHAGHASYLLGNHSDQGWWYYFPVVFAVKSTITALIATALLLAAGVAGWKRWRAIPFFWYGLLIPPIVYFALSMTSGINIGMRHILPVYPFLYLAVAVLLSWASVTWRARFAMLGLACLQIAECAWIAPDYLAFFNALVGGPGKGPHYLVDSNIDWGQDVKKLKKWLKAHGTNTARVWYFGNAQMDYYGVYADAFPDPEDKKGWDAINGYGVVSVTVLEGVYVPLNTVAPLRQKEPVAKVGWSMYVYDLRKGRGGLEARSEKREVRSKK